MRHLALLLLTIASLSIGCSRNLDKQTAAEEIQRALANDKNIIYVNVGKVKSRCEVENDRGESSPGGLTPGLDRDTIIAQAVGYLAVTPVGKDSWNISLTEKGQSVMSAEGEHLYARKTGEGCDYQLGTFLIATPELVEVTEIRGGPHAAVAYFTYKWKVTELGAALQKNGVANRKLTPLQRAELTYNLVRFSSPVAVKIPVPPEDVVDSGSLMFARGDGGWKPTYLPKY